MPHIRGQTGSVHGTLEIIQKGKSPVWNRFNQTQEGLNVVSILFNLCDYFRYIMEVDFSAILYLIFSYSIQHDH